MPLPERFPPRPSGGTFSGEYPALQKFCAWRDRWGISSDLAVRLTQLQERLPEFTLLIISGFRTTTEQQELRDAGRPTAPDNLSTHLSCPATGADLAFDGVTATDALKARFGSAARLVGLRWGGGGAINPETGIPLDWNHVDLGPRT